jgi:hypothetical protein
LGVFHLIDSAVINAKHSRKPVTLSPVTLRTSINVKDSSGKMHFMHIKNRKDGEPVGILVKKSDVRRKRLTRQIHQIPDDAEVIEVIGVREPDNDHDRENVYRNKVIVNNKLMPYRLTDHQLQHAIRIEN